MNVAGELVELGAVADVTDFVANGSFEALRLNVRASTDPDYAILVRLVDHNAGWQGPFSYVDKDSFDFLRKSTVLPGDVLVANVGANAGTVFRAPELGRPMTLGPNSILCKPRDPQRLSRTYLYYLLASPQGMGLVSEILSGSAQPKFNKTDFRRIPIVLPDISTQLAITELLGALDDKISANTKLAVITDDLVRAEYIALSENVPETRTIASIATHPRDLVEPSQTDGNLIYVGLEHVPRRRMWLSESGLSSDVTSTKASFAKGDVLFGKLRPYFHKVVSAPADGISSTDILVLRAKHSSLAGFLLAAAASDATVERCAAASEGTRMPRTSWKDLAAIEVPWPGDTAAQAFSATVAAIRDRIESAMVENRRLADTRDALLPQLMSGRIRVRDADRVVEGVV